MRSKVEVRRGERRRRLGAAALLASTLLLTIAVSGCSVSSGPVVAEDNDPAPTQTRSADEVAADAARANKREACSAFDESMSTFADMSLADPTAETYASGLKELAFALGDQALEVGDTGDVGLDLLLAHLASETAAFADDYSATGEVTTARWLSFRTGVKAVGDACGQTWDVED